MQKWWDQWPDANIGIATGAASGIVALDIDPRNRGDESYAKLQEELQNSFGELLKVRSGSGGTHLYFRHPGSHVSSRANVWPGIDVKGDGGYVVAPPSHHASGARYHFASNNGFMLQPLGPALLDLIAPRAQAHGQSEQFSKIGVDSLRVSDEIKQLIRGGKPKGKRSGAIFAAIRAMVKAGHTDEEILNVCLDPENGLSDRPREKGEAWLRGEITRGRTKPESDKSGQGTAGSTRAKTISAATLMEKKLSPLVWVAEQLVPEGLAILAGKPKMGLARFRPPPKKGNSVYLEDYGVAAALKQLADKHHIAVLLIHHLRKEPGQDRLDEISGSTGITGGADTILIMKRPRTNQSEARLFVTGRDVEEVDIALRSDPQSQRWVCAGAASDVDISPERRAIIDVLKDAECPLAPSQVASRLGKDENAVKQLMFKMARDGQLKNIGGSYIPVT